MDQVKYTPMMRQYLEKIMPLAEQLASADVGKSRQQLDAEVSKMMEYMRAIRLINKYHGGDGAGLALLQKTFTLFNRLRMNFWWSGAPGSI